MLCGIELENLKKEKSKSPILEALRIMRETQWADLIMKPEKSKKRRSKPTKSIEGNNDG